MPFSGRKEGKEDNSNEKNADVFLKRERQG